MSDAPLDVLSQLWRVNHALEKLSRQMLASIGVTGPQRLALRIVGTTPDISATALARALRLDPSTITGILRRLHEAGMLERTTDDRDGRRVRLRLTDAGRAVDTREQGTVEAAMTRALNALSPSERAAVVHFLSSFELELELERTRLHDGG
jgi:MarR family transcriptional regulator, organic hydroperoxide resistance regulator